MANDAAEPNNISPEPQPAPGQGPAQPPVKSGHPIGFWFFFWGEFAERSSYYGMRAILALYMTERLGFGKEDGATVISLFIAGCYLLPLVGGWIADNYLGKYWTIVGFSIPYLIGHALIGIENKYMVFFALLLLAMGSGVIKPNISTLMGLTYDQQRPGQDQLRASAFSWFYLAINVGAFISQLAVPWIRSNYDYATAFFFPAVLMAVSLAIFAMGKPFYAVEKIERKKLPPEQAAEQFRLKMETLGRIGKVFLLIMFFWAVFDQSASTWIYFADVYMDTTLVGTRADGTAVILSSESIEKLTQKFSDVIFSITGIKTSPSSSVNPDADAIQAFNPLFIIVFLPICVYVFRQFAKAGNPVRPTTKISIGFILTTISMGIMSVAGLLTSPPEKMVKLTTHAGTFILPLANVTLEEAGTKEVPVDMSLEFSDAIKINAEDIGYDAEKKRAYFNSGRIILGEVDIPVRDGMFDFANAKNLFIDDKVDYPELSEIVIIRKGVFPYGEGKSISIDEKSKYKILEESAPEPKAGADAPTVSLEETDWVPPSKRVTIWWQVLAYLILTIAEILISVTGLELAYVIAPPTMKSFVTACWLFTVFLANALINAPLTRLYPVMDPSSYFAMLAVALLIVWIIFIPVSRQFNNVGANPEPPSAS